MYSNPCLNIRDCPTRRQSVLFLPPRLLPRRARPLSLPAPTEPTEPHPAEPAAPPSSEPAASARATDGVAPPTSPLLHALSSGDPVSARPRRLRASPAPSFGDPGPACPWRLHARRPPPRCISCSSDAPPPSRLVPRLQGHFRAGPCPLTTELVEAGIFQLHQRLTPVRAHFLGAP